MGPWASKARQLSCMTMGVTQELRDLSAAGSEPLQ